VSPGSFLAHYDAAGGIRPYGLHWPFALGSKISAVLEELRRIRADQPSAPSPAAPSPADSASQPGGKNGKKRARSGGSRAQPAAPPPPPSKAIVFCGSASGRSQVSGVDLPSPLDVLAQALSHEIGDAAWSRVEGDYTHERRAEALCKFQEQRECFVLLLPVKAAASGLNLTVANHVLLLDLQADHRAELQLISRCWRIGQTRPVHVKRFVSSGTVEERMLELRRKTTGVLAAGDGADVLADERAAVAAPSSIGALDGECADAAASSRKQPMKQPAAPATKGAAAAAAAAERLEDAKYLAGLS